MKALRLPGLFLDATAVVSIEKYDDAITLVTASFSAPDLGGYGMFTSSESVLRTHRVALSFDEVQAAYDVAMSGTKA